MSASFKSYMRYQDDRPAAWSIHKSILFATFFCLFAMTASCATPKVTDPSDPRFDKTQFRFEDYNNQKSFDEVMQKLFPVGTTEEQIDQFLITYGGAQKYDDGLILYPGKRTARYYKIDAEANHVKCQFTVLAPFNKDHTLGLKIWAGYECDGP